MRTFPWVLTAAGLTLLAGCATVPEKDTQVCAPSDSGPSAADIARKHRQLAVRGRESGDLAGAAREWQIVALLQPNDEAARTELAATRSAITRGVDEQMQAANAALQKGDRESASLALLRALALSPEHVEAARILREIEKQQMTLIATGKAAKAKLEGNPYKAGAAVPSASASGPRATPLAKNGNGEQHQAFDLEQRLEMFKAGDTVGGLAELRRYVEANPKDGAARQRISQAVYERARQYDTPTTPENALAIYEQALYLRGETVPAWKDRVAQLRKNLAATYYDKGMAAFNSDLKTAIKDFETCLRFDPKHPGATLKLREARQAQSKLKDIGASQTGKQ